MSTSTRQNANTAEIINALINITASFVAMDGYSIAAAIEAALDYEIDFNFTNNGNSWQRTTGNRYGITAEQVKAAIEEDQKRYRQAADEERRIQQERAAMRQPARNR